MITLHATRYSPIWFCCFFSWFLSVSQFSVSQYLLLLFVYLNNRLSVCVVMLVVCSLLSCVHLPRPQLPPPSQPLPQHFHHSFVGLLLTHSTRFFAKIVSCIEYLYIYILNSCRAHVPCSGGVHLVSARIVNLPDTLCVPLSSASLALFWLVSLFLASSRNGRQAFLHCDAPRKS